MILCMIPGFYKDKLVTDKRSRDMENIDHLKSELKTLVEAANDLQSLEKIRVEALGKKGKITQELKQLGKMDPDTRRQTGQALNALKDEIADIIKCQEMALRKQEMDARLDRETIDVTLPARFERQGGIHPISQSIEEITVIFSEMGFQIAEGPDIEDDWHNFEALNFPPGHPAREMQDTFFLPDDKEAAEKAGNPAFGKKLLRTHTSSVQIRTMCEQKPPYRLIVPGRVYRHDYDMTHTPMFHQIEGLLIDENINMSHLKGCLIEFCRAFFGVEELKARFRPSFFPFTEPSAEMDIGCAHKNGELKLGEGEDWMEILGCGMVHPNVLRNCGIDPDQYQGFAFGMGVERMAMLKYGIPDLRTLFEGDVRWLDHYGFSGIDRPNAIKGV